MIDTGSGGRWWWVIYGVVAASSRQVGVDNVGGERLWEARWWWGLTPLTDVVVNVGGCQVVAVLSCHWWWSTSVVGHPWVVGSCWCMGSCQQVVVDVGRLSGGGCHVMVVNVGGGASMDGGGHVDAGGGGMVCPWGRVVAASSMHGLTSLMQVVAASSWHWGGQHRWWHPWVVGSHRRQVGWWLCH